jgi:hypothetical protein
MTYDMTYAENTADHNYDSVLEGPDSRSTSMQSRSIICKARSILPIRALYLAMRSGVGGKGTRGGCGGGGF